MKNNSKIKGCAFNLSWPLLFTLVFTVLKLTNYIDWSWWWVTCPIWLPIGLVFTYLILTIIFYAIFCLIDVTYK